MRKTILIWMIVMIVLGGFGTAEEIYTGADTNDMTIMGTNAGNNIAWSEKVTFNSTFELNDAFIWIKTTTGSPSGIKVEIWQDNSCINNPKCGTFLVASNISDALVTDASYNAIPFDDYILTSGQAYWFVYSSITESEGNGNWYMGRRSNTGNIFGDGYSTERDGAWADITTRDVKVGWNVTLYVQPSSLTINLTTTTNPTTNQDFDINTVSINTTGNFSYPSATNCSVYINGTLNHTINGYASGINQLINFNLTFPSNQANSYSYFLGCIDNTTATNTSSTTFFIDMVAPTLTTNFINNSLVFNRNYTSWFNATDTLVLNSVNISIDGLTYIYNDTMTGTTFNKQLIINSYNLTPGTHNLTVRIADGHTAQEIPEYKVKQPILDDWIKYEFYEREGYVKIKGLPNSIWDRFTTEKKRDRYEFEYEPWDKSQTEYSFEVESDSYIKIIERPDTKYGSWIIMNDKWMDFYTEDNPFDTVEITRISDKKVRVLVSNIALNDGKIRFKSIGDLNIVQENFTFITSNYTLSYSDPVLVLENQRMTFDVSDFSGLSSVANLTWNNTIQTVTKKTPAGLERHTADFTTTDFNSNENITFTWEYFVTDGTSTESGNISFVQEVLNIGIDDCSTYTTQAINYSIKNDSTEALINGTAAGAFRIWINDSTSYKAFNLSWSQPSFGVCINPSSVNVTYYTQLEYTAAGQTKTYYINDANLDNATDFVNLYITDGTTQVTFTVIDENDNPVPNVFINVLAYDLGTNSFKTTEIVQTDSNGKAIANIILNTQFYKFLLTYNSEIVLTTEPTKITSATQTFQITLGEDYLDSFTTYNNIACSMDFDNASKGFTYTFLDSTNTAVEGCLEIVRSTLNSDTVINTSCLTAAAGIINLYIGEDVQDYTYYARGKVSVDDNSFICADESVSFTQNFKKFGREGLMATFLLTLALIAIGLWSPIASIILATVGLIAMFFMGMFFMTPAILITYIIMAILLVLRMNK